MASTVPATPDSTRGCAIRAEAVTVGDVIGYVQGTAVSDRVVLTCGGIGLAVACPQPLHVGDEVALWVTTVVREDSITCYGFSEQDAQTCFAALIKVSGVGPTAALALLRDVGVADIAAAVRDNDSVVLCRAGGVGPGVARKILAGIQLPGSLMSSASGPVDSVHTEVTGALTGLGFPDAEAAKAVAAAAATGADDEASLLAGALAVLRS
jgi:holliday junction DNA helicase RuvA